MTTDLNLTSIVFSMRSSGFLPMSKMGTMFNFYTMLSIVPPPSPFFSLFSTRPPCVCGMKVGFHGHLDSVIDLLPMAQSVCGPDAEVQFGPVL